MLENSLKNLQDFLLGDEQKDQVNLLKLGGDKFRPIVFANSTATNATKTVSNKVKTVGTGFIELNQWVYFALEMPAFFIYQYSWLLFQLLGGNIGTYLYYVIANPVMAVI